MSDSGESTNDGVERQALNRLEAAVSRLIESRSEIKSRALDAEQRIHDLEKLLGQSEEDQLDVTKLRNDLAELKAQNSNLKVRISEGREGGRETPFPDSVPRGTGLNPTAARREMSEGESKRSVTVRIAGDEHILRSTAEPEYTRRCAEFLDERVAEIRAFHTTPRQPPRRYPCGSLYHRSVFSGTGRV